MYKYVGFSLLSLASHDEYRYADAQTDRRTDDGAYILFIAPICVIMPKFMQIGLAVAEIWPFVRFSRWRPSAILDLLYIRLFGPPAIMSLSLCTIWFKSVQWFR